jgi:hypothetical protein
MHGMEEGNEHASGLAPLKAAMAKIQALLDGVELETLRNGGKPKAVKVEIEAGAHGEPDGDECPACMDGTCDDPDHMADEEMSGMADMYGAKGE